MEEGIALIATLEDKINAMKQLARGLFHIHSKNLVHCDIKPTNIMISRNGTPRFHQIKIIDFENAYQVEDLIELIDSIKEGSSLPLGTFNWYAPEAFIENKYSVKSDIFSMGLVFFFVISGGKNAFGDTFWQYNIQANTKREDYATRE